MIIEQTRELLEKEPNFRRQQIMKAVFCNLIENWDEAMTLPKSLREKLSEVSLDIDAEVFESRDNKTVKALITLSDKEKIETVLMKHPERNTICLSSQVGCAMKCSYCATGQMGFKRNLTVDEILIQVLFWTRFLKKQDRHLTNIVFMGMGEPFLNYENFIESVKIINDNEYFNIGARKISVSTCGILEGIDKLKNEDLQINLAISLHAPNDKIRSKIMPINTQHNIKTLMKAVEKYVMKTNRKVMFEYLLLNRLNDQVEHAKELITLMQNGLYVVNLVKYNATGKKHSRSNMATVQKFKQTLEDHGIQVTERFSYGQDIAAACGQLANKSKN
jgi:23S rRNA (adenine2503-C2)-methyltransferase